MKCKKCGNQMADGARFCIACGAEHDAKGQLVKKGSGVDYNKTVMANDVPLPNRGSGIDYNKTMMASGVPRGKIDYNKTMMASDVPRSKIDYNKTMMASDVPHNNIDYNKTMMAADVHPNAVNSPKKKKLSPVFIILPILVGLGVAGKIVLTPKPQPNPSPVEASANASASANVSEGSAGGGSIIGETPAAQSTDSSYGEVQTAGGIVSDFDPSEGYWSKDAEFFYRNGSIVTNAWVGDSYVGSDGRKLRNKLVDGTYYVDASGVRLKNEWYRVIKKISNSDVSIWYYFGEDGAMLRDTITPDGFYVDEDGIYIPGTHMTKDSDKYVPNN